MCVLCACSVGQSLKYSSNSVDKTTNRTAILVAAMHSSGYISDMSACLFLLQITGSMLPEKRVECCPCVPVHKSSSEISAVALGIGTQYIFLIPRGAAVSFQMVLGNI